MSILSIILLSQAIYANDLLNLKSKAMNTFYQAELKKLEGQKISDPRHETVTEKFFPGIKLELLKYMEQKTSIAEATVIDINYCNKLCLDYGTSSIQKTMSNIIPQMKVSHRANDCIEKCKGLQNESQLFYDGLTLGLNQRIESTNCNGIINSSNRNSNEKILHLSHQIESIQRKDIQK